MPPLLSHDRWTRSTPGYSLRPASIIIALAGSILAATALSARAQSVTKPIARTSSCATANCHVSIVDRPNLHKPVADSDCLACHEYDDPAQHSFSIRAVDGNQCISCHEPIVGTVTHQPVAEGQCLTCHDAHGSEHPALLVADPAGGLCQSCHESEKYLEQDFVHGPVAVGACVICHQPHASDISGLLRKPTTALCNDCHTDIKPPVGMDASLVHAPASDDCTLCHDPHAERLEFLLKDAPPSLCYSCHTDVQDMVTEAPVKHGPVTDPNGCPQCHNPHFSETPKLQKLAQPELCLTCHDQPIEASDGKTLMNMAQLLEDNPHMHGPIREGNCTACHQPHAEDHFRLLHNEYPPEFYAPFKMERYKLCFTCHKPDLVLQEAGTGLTGFRNGDQNLHFVHVNRENGRTCRACHEVHASAKPFHIREEVPYGTSGWMLPINFSQNDTGGSCTPACHKTRQYDRDVLGLPISDPKLLPQNRNDR